MKSYLRRLGFNSFSKIKKSQTSQAKKHKNFIVHKKKRHSTEIDIKIEGINLNKFSTVKDLIFSEEVMSRQEEDFQRDSNFEVIDLLEAQNLVEIPQAHRQISARVSTQRQVLGQLPGPEEPAKSKKPPNERIVETEEDFLREFNRLNRSFENNEIEYEPEDVRRSLQDYKKRQTESAQKRLKFEDLLLIYLKFLRNPKVQKPRYVGIFETLRRDPVEGLRLVKQQVPFLAHQNELIFFLKAFAHEAQNLNAWEIWRVWEVLENRVVACAKFCSVDELELFCEVLSQIGVVSPEFVQEYEEVVLDSKSEIFSLERARIFNRLYGIVQFFVAQREVRSEFLFEIARWSILMFK